jgi:hypothetical protein
LAKLLYGTEQAMATAEGMIADLIGTGLQHQSQNLWDEFRDACK